MDQGVGIIEALRVHIAESYARPQRKPIIEPVRDREVGVEQIGVAFAVVDLVESVAYHTENRDKIVERVEPDPQSSIETILLSRGACGRRGNECCNQQKRQNGSSLHIYLGLAFDQFDVAAPQKTFYGRRLTPLDNNVVVANGIVEQIR